ncbi:hypothetical protein [Actinomyces wuliandei]|uniref:hypothetical protein n=1 Tax=Actinomyces wuliandei TaxID=2057743 RepID=UPI00214B356F|nr:hypothetical protein [Actinomyces wuliandei]
MGGREETPPGDVGGEPVGNVSPGWEAPAGALSETRRLVTACLPEHLRVLDAEGARLVAGLLDERLAAGWQPAQIRSLMDQPLPPRVHRLSALVAARLRANVDPALAPSTVPTSDLHAARQAEARRQEAVRRRSEELAGTVREADPVREAAEASAWERARREAPGASRLGLARRVNEILAEGGAAGSRGRGGRRSGRGRGRRARGRVS